MNTHSLRQTFEQWARYGALRYQKRPWLLSKWEVVEGIEWERVKQEMLIKDIATKLNLGEKERLVELGCAGAWLLEGLAGRIKRTFGLDFSHFMLKSALRRSKRYRLVGGELGLLPFRADSFDGVLCIYVFINLTDDGYVKQSIREILRVLKRGGRALVGQLPDDTMSAQYEKAKKEYFTYCQERYQLGRSVREKFKPPLRLFNKDKILKFLKAEGIKVQVLPSFNPFYRDGQPLSVDWRFDLLLKKGP